MRAPVFSDRQAVPPPVGRTMREKMRDLLDQHTREYLALAKASEGVPNSQRTASRQCVRALAKVIALYEGGYPDAPMVKVAEQMSVDRVKRGYVQKHSCGALILVNGMCEAGHDPRKAMR